jgi:acyl-CoA thioester hydrolase
VPAHILELRVYYQDTDAGGIVYHANYLAFAERARTEALRTLGVPHGEMVRQFGVQFVVRRVNLHYQRPARLDEVIRVETRIAQVGGASVTLRQNFWRDSESLAVLEVGLGCVRVSGGTAARIPAAWAAKLRADITE